MITMEGYHLRPSEAVLQLREEFPDFLICELRSGSGRPSFVATSTRTGSGDRTELIVRGGTEELRKALRALEGGAA